MRSLEKRVSHRFYAAWLVAALAAALACVPAFAFAEESENAETGGDGGAIAAEATFDEVNAEVAEPAPDASEVVALELDGSDDPNSSDGIDEEAGADDPSDGADGSQPEGPNDPVKPVEPIVPGLKTVGDRFQYVNDDGTLVKSDWKTVGDKRYYFDAEGVSVRWAQKIDGCWYYFNGNGVMQTGWIVWHADGLKSYFDRDGKARTGWQAIDGKWYYFDPATGKSLRWARKIGGATYYFNSQSQMHTGLLTWVADGLKSYYGSDGKQLTGWQKVDGKWYYFDPATGKSLRWARKIGGATYYFNSQSQMHTGLLTWVADGLKSYYGSDGKQLTGWQKVDGKWYYFDPATGKSLRWERKIGSHWYYFNSQSQMHTGWLKWSGKQQWSYYWSNGLRASGTQVIGGYEYRFDANGRTSTAPVTKSSAELAMEKRAQGYSSSTSYMILVNRSTHKVGIFERKSGRWDMIAYWDCVTGKPSTPTITGSFKTTGGKRSSLSTDSRAKYCTQITGGYFFHTILASNNELGKSLSHGCIRMSYSSAQWIYRHIHAGTRVVIY